MLETQACLEESLESSALAAERVDHVSAGLDKGSLEHVREKREHTVQRLELFVLTDATVVDTSEELGKDGEIENERRGQEGVLERKERH